MTIESVTTDEYGAVGEVISVDVPPPTAPVLMSDRSTVETTTETTAEAWTTFQAKATAFFAQTTQATVTFFREHQQLLSMLGWFLLAFLGIRVLFAALDAIDDILLVTPALKLIGLATVAWFIWRYLVRANNRQELAQMFNHAKAEFFGSQE